MHRAPSTNVTIDLSAVSSDFISIFTRGRDEKHRKKRVVGGDGGGSFSSFFFTRVRYQG